MTQRPWIRILAPVAVILIAAFFVWEIDARGRGGGGRGGGGGGGGRISRSGPASMGSMRHTRPSTGSMQRSRPSAGTRERQRGDRAPKRAEARPATDDRRPDREDRGDRREENRDDRREHRQDQAKDRQEFRQNEYHEHSEYWYDYDEWQEDRWRFAVGASLASATFHSLSCQSETIVVGSVSYYRCGPTWYQRSYSGGNVTYIVVNTPSGY